MNLEDLLSSAIQTSIEAGKATLMYYQSELKIEYKSDNSPLTLADKASNSIIVKSLQQTNIPIISEESKPEEFKIRSRWEYFWLIDPLDGTKEFINRSDEYTINIALVKNSEPILGVVYSPAKDLLFYALEDFGAYKVEKVDKMSVNQILDDKFRLKLPLKSKHDIPVVVASKSHKNQETQDFIEGIKKEFKEIVEESYGSSLKLCMVGEGSADIYPRLGPTMEWDTAASHVIVKVSGCHIVQYPSLKPMIYNKENLLNPYFIVYNNKMKKAVK